MVRSKKQMKRSYTTLASKSIIQTNEPRYLSEDQIASLIGGSMNSEAVVEHQEARKIDHRKRQYHKHITALNPTSKGRMPFIVADTETVLINEIHVPYAVGFLVVEPGDTLSSERLEAKKSGNDALSYVYKILMNSLYGRFGINPKSTITEVCDSERYKKLVRKTALMSSDQLSDSKYIVTYHSNTETDYWDSPKNSAVQTCAQSQPMLGSICLFKLEDKIAQGYFLAPKTYYYKSEKGKEIIKYKGLPKNEITPEWFRLQYADPARKLQVEVEANFRIEWSKLNIFKKDILVQVGLNQGTKRIPLYRGGVWADTEPIDVKDLSRLDNISKKLMERDITENKKGMEERENIEKEMKEEPTLEGVTNPTIDEIPKTDKKKPKTGKKDKKKAKKTATTTKKKKKPPKAFSAMKSGELNQPASLRFYLQWNTRAKGAMLTASPAFFMASELVNFLSSLLH
ncbi:DNA polymerase-like protein [Tanacetum coccineum]